VIIGGDGTPCQPIIVRGATEGTRTTLQGSVGIMGSYVIVEHLDVDLSTDENDQVGVSSSDHVAFRHSEIRDLDIDHNTTVFFVGSSDHVVILGNHIHDNGDFGTGGEIDVHGIGARDSWDLWIVDNHIHHNRGDGMQFGHQAGNTLGRIYVGRNDIHDNGENSVDIKEASNVIVSENTLHGEPEGNVVFHDCPVGAALIYNEVYDAAYGVSMASLESNCDDELPVSLFVLQNDFHDISGNAIQGWGSGKRYYVAGNSFASVGERVGIDIPGSGSRISEDDAALEDGFAAFEALYGLDIRP
jgi:hypothetical protein